MSFVIRTWNLYHGRTAPAGRRLHLRRMIELVTGDRPDLVALQEVPLWAVGRLEGWSGMAARSVVTVPALLPGSLARRVTAVHPARMRSLVSGQANVLLAGSRLRLDPGRTLLLNAEAERWDSLLRRGPQRRYCQRHEVATNDGRTIVVGHLHASHDPRWAVVEIERAAAFVGAAAPAIFCGDFNAAEHPVAGYSTPIPGVDQILVCGLELERGPKAWPKDRRFYDGELLSDHAPVEAVVT
jgi:endonuclease/exonuclease/phosphatase family metal-dependent hydrolase